MALESRSGGKRFGLSSLSASLSLVLTFTLVAPSRSTHPGIATSISALGLILAGVSVSGFMIRAPVLLYGWPQSLDHEMGRIRCI